MGAWPQACHLLVAALPGVRGHAKGHGSDKCWLCHLLSGGNAGLRDEKWAGPERLVYGQPGVRLGSSCSEMGSLSGSSNSCRTTPSVAPSSQPELLPQKVRCPLLTAAHPICSQVAPGAVLGASSTYGVPLATRPESRPRSVPLTFQPTNRLNPRTLQMST